MEDKRLIIEYNLEYFSNNIELSFGENSDNYMYQRNESLKRF